MNQYSVKITDKALDDMERKAGGTVLLDTFSKVLLPKRTVPHDAMMRPSGHRMAPMSALF